VNDENRLQFERYIQLLNRRKFVFVIPVILAVLGAAIVSFIQSEVYVATSTARVDLTQAGIDTSDSSSVTRFLNTYSRLVQNSQTLDRVVEDLNLSDSEASGLSERVFAEPIRDTDLVEIRAEAGTAEQAAAIANALLNLLRDQQFIDQFLTDSTLALRAQVESTRLTLEDEQAVLANLQSSGASDSQIEAQQGIVDATQSAYQALLTRLSNEQANQEQPSQAFTVWEEATPPDYPVSPRWRFNLAAGLLAGIAAGVALSLVLEYIDPTLRGVRDLEAATRLPVLASIPFGIRWKYPPPPVSPDYRLLATKLQTALQEGGRRSILFTSTRPEEGNTTVATYAGMAMAQAGMRVLLLDANLSRPDLHKLFNLPLAPGLYNFVSANGARPHDPIPDAAPGVIQTSPVPRLSVLTAGNKMSDASELLASAEMREFLDYLETQYDAIIIDGSAMSTGAGSAVMAPVVDGVVLVAAEGQASRGSVEETVEELTSLGAKTIGLVYCKATEA
jgi:capsular exopolysaccharide synthesis family protein